jgi:hypothetical protein
MCNKKKTLANMKLKLKSTNVEVADAQNMMQSKIESYKNSRQKFTSKIIISSYSQIATTPQSKNKKSFF